MKKNPFAYVVADREFYAPLESATEPGDPLRPAAVPDGWEGTVSGPWTVWRRAAHHGAEDGWKVHVSARPDRLVPVLDTVARVCFAHAVHFKHLSGRSFHHWTHAKQASRVQNGKFVAAYPPDAPAARRLMEHLSAELEGEEGPYILTDRRFGTSRTVHYRYGAFVPRRRVRPDGTTRYLVRDGHGALVEDRRALGFFLPDGLTDPFRPTGPRRAARARRPEGSARTDQPPTFGGFAFEEAIRFSNAGGTYRGRDVATGRAVFIKEARAHCGVATDGTTAPQALDTEWETLCRLHRDAPGLAPRPIERFRVWEHDFLVTELIDGRPLSHWMSGTSPLLRVTATRADVLAYYERCERIVAAIEGALTDLHAAGYLFVDVSPGNVLIDRDDRVRLVDFEAARPVGSAFTPLGTPGYSPPPALRGDDPTVYDTYGLCALTHLLLGPLQQVARRNPDALTHQHAELARSAPVPRPLWDRVTRYHRPRGRSPLPGPEEVAADPLTHLTALRDGVGDALLAMADPAHPGRVFPTIMEGYQTNTLCVAYGTAGVVHALSRAGRPLPEGVLHRLREDALGAADALAPGLYVGTAGIARVLADHGMLTEATDLLAAADRHPLTADCATLYGGSAGLALAHLALYGHTRDPHHVDRALALVHALPRDDGALAERLGPDGATGLLHGPCGVALLLQQLAAVTGDTAHLARGVRLLHAELDRATDPGAPDLTFPVSAADSRVVAYLFSGSAGLAHTLDRYLGLVDDERLTDALPRLLAPLHLLTTVMPGLYQGLSGYGLVLADHARLTGDPVSRAAAVRAARGLFKYAIPHESGIRFLGDQSLRYSADLYSGSAGVLLFLAQLLAPRPDALLTVDALAAPSALTPA
ncbi:class III lanthionine synthetase LanKC [Streptomyces chumphonensis]|uniref:Class III lanthionine synthetase LanKC n=1 Tax=Streptomyces chumphonensis TaxID=1214925 RepID=A0A927EYJ8_9ACTN|nr:class III lanthionine synthetase LanKC [Streptomyces chumphonensis]MBD3931793.1 class III lanthionine synthetase LanKC [Streptomyces chumphonensis]